MCYTGYCDYEDFNPITGNCSCRRGKNPCPEDAETIEMFMCPYCEEEFPEDGQEECPECGAHLQR